MSNFIKTVKRRLTPTITAGAYAANDVVGGRQEIDLGTKPLSGTLERIKIVDDSNVKAALTFHFFTEQPAAAFADNAGPFVLANADLLKLDELPIAFVTGDYTSISDGSGQSGIAIKKAIDFDFYTPTGKLHLYIVSPSTPTYLSTSDLTIDLTFSVNA